MKGSKFIWLVVGIITIVLYGLFDPDRYPFPKCPFRLLTGWLCPGCGSQRAMHQLLHGHIGAAFHLNPLFLPGVLYVLTGLMLPILFPKEWPRIRQTFYGLKAGYISLALILIFWITRNIF